MIKTELLQVWESEANWGKSGEKCVRGEVRGAEHSTVRSHFHLQLHCSPISGQCEEVADFKELTHGDVSFRRRLM